MIGKLLNLFNQKQDKEKMKKLKEIDKEIANCTTYKEIVRLTNLYNKIKNENKTD
jgi:aerobic-type carbon monoxide dehydrogenase small subunit (CoxS/CutS family)